MLSAAREGRITLHTSAVLLAELEDVLSREKFVARIARVGSSVSQMLAGFRALSAIVRPAPLEATSRDPDDDHVLACALAAKAILILTRDRDLLDLGTFRDVRILAAHDALQLINSTAG